MNETTEQSKGNRADFMAFMNSQMRDPEFSANVRRKQQELKIWLQLQQARMDAGISQSELARRLGKNQAQISRLEDPDKPDGYSVMNIIEFVMALGDDFEVNLSIGRKKKKTA
ncbi:MAG: helix-turn-helix transcriptional regulator [Chloroflexota bacterium]